jgi:NADPH:quinone reductase-like Zn-dependent oxidoreductase
MRAAVRYDYGGPDRVELRDVELPKLTADGLLVRVQSASVNPRDSFVTLSGMPLVARIGAGLLRPKSVGLGVDFAGAVEAIGPDVTDFREGDRVFGLRTGAFAEYVCVRNAVARIPDHVSYAEAAAAPTAGLTALQALRAGNVRRGCSVVINGASGGVGTIAVQIAASLGAEVTGVCSTANVDLVRSLGADHVVDYTQEDFTRSGRRYDVLIDNAGSRPWSHVRRILSPDATVVLVGGSQANRVVGPLAHWSSVKIASAPASQRVLALMMTRIDRTDMEVLRDMLERKTIVPIIDRGYDLDDVAEALSYVRTGHARAKVIVRVQRDVGDRGVGVTPSAHHIALV